MRKFIDARRTRVSGSPASLNVKRERFGEHERGLHIHIEQFVPRALINIQQVTVQRIDARVVHQNVHASEAFQRCAQQACAVLRVRHMACATFNKIKNLLNKFLTLKLNFFFVLYDNAMTKLCFSVIEL